VPPKPPRNGPQAPGAALLAPHVHEYISSLAPCPRGLGPVSRFLRTWLGWDLLLLLTSQLLLVWRGLLLLASQLLLVWWGLLLLASQSLLVRGLLLLLASQSLAQSQSSAPNQIIKNSPKLMLRTSTGVVKNKADPVGTYATTLGGINFGVIYYMTSRLSAGVSYRSDFDFLGGKAPTTKGFEITGRIYPFDQGTYTAKTWEGNVLEFQSSYAMYLMSEFTQKSYVLKTKDKNGNNEEGGFASINAGVGYEQRISRHFEFNIEGVYSAYIFAATDSDKQFRSIIANLGFNFLW
jgi:hypothetical protein